MPDSKQLLEWRPKPHSSNHLHHLSQSPRVRCAVHACAYIINGPLPCKRDASNSSSDQESANDQQTNVVIIEREGTTKGKETIRCRLEKKSLPGTRLRTCIEPRARSEQISFVRRRPPEAVVSVSLEETCVHFRDSSFQTDAGLRIAQMFICPSLKLFENRGKPVREHNLEA